jgi:hypothetical protein
MDVLYSIDWGSSQAGKGPAGDDTVTWQLIASDDSPIGSPSNVGIIESPAGCYSVLVTHAMDFQGWIQWVSGGANSDTKREPINPTVATGGGGGGSGVGEGDIPVDHDYGGVDNLRILLDGNPVDNAVIRAYTAAEYDSDDPLPRTPPKTYSGSDGRWIAPLMLDADDYVFTAYNPVTKITDTMRETVE